MEKRARFSVVIPYGNAEGTLRICLESVLAAADRLAAAGAAHGVEVICANGGSDDGSDALVAGFAAKDPRVVPLLGRPTEEGPGPARNRGLAAAQGDYLVFVDADDTLDPDAFVRLKDATADIVTFLPPAGTFGLSRPEDRRRTFSPLVGNLLVWNAIYRREAVAWLSFPNLVNHEDLVWTCGAYARARTLAGGVSPWYRHDAHVAGSAAHTHSWRRVRAAWAATAMMWRAVRPAFAAGPVALRLVMARKLLAHLLLHVLREALFAARPRRKPEREVNGMAVVDALFRANGVIRPGEVWVHGMWTPDKWLRGLKAKLCGKTLVRMTHQGLSPVALRRRSRWKKRLVAPLERLLFALSDRIVVTGPWEEEWNRAWGLKGPFETVDLKTFFDLSRPVAPYAPAAGRATRALYLGRLHPLKGVDILEEAAARLGDAIDLRIESHLFGADKERAWRDCDVLVLPTLSENFGLVVAEALERGKPVITTDGAPAWKGFPGVTYVDGFVSASRAEQVEMLARALSGGLY